MSDYAYMDNTNKPAIVAFYDMTPQNLSIAKPLNHDPNMGASPLG